MLVICGSYAQIRHHRRVERFFHMGDNSTGVSPPSVTPAEAPVSPEQQAFEHQAPEHHEPELTAFDRLLFEPATFAIADAPAATEDPHASDLALELANAPGPVGNPIDPDTATVDAPVFDFSDRVEPAQPRTSPLGWAGLFFAFAVPPLGFLLSVTAFIFAKVRHNWRTWPVTLGITVSIVLSVVLVTGGLVASYFAGEDAKVAAVEADAAPFCAAIDARPGVLETPGFGWSSERQTVSDSIRTQRAFRDEWAELAKIAPAEVRPGIQAVSDAAAAIVTNTQNTRSVNLQSNLDQINSVTSASNVRSYVAQYCGN